MFIIPVVVTICTHLIAHSRGFQQAEERFLISTSHFANRETRAQGMGELATISQRVIRRFRKESQGSRTTCRCCWCHHGSQKWETGARHLITIHFAKELQKPRSLNFGNSSRLTLSFSDPDSKCISITKLQQEGIRYKAANASETAL